MWSLSMYLTKISSHTLQGLQFDGAIELFKLGLPLAGRMKLNDSVASRKAPVRSVTSSRHMPWDMCPAVQSLTST